MSKLNIIKKELIQNMNKSLNLIKVINKISRNLSPDEIFAIYELSFLKIYLSWESFIGRVFILYMIGEKTDNGYAPKRYVTPRDEKHAYDMIKSGRSHPPDWLNLEFIREKSELFFENGKPFKPVLYTNTTITGALQNMKVLRNIIVHASKEAEEKYKNMLRTDLGSARRISPGEFLSMTRNKNPKDPYIVYYKKILELVSNRIVR